MMWPTMGDVCAGRASGRSLGQGAEVTPIPSVADGRLRGGCPRVPSPAGRARTRTRSRAAACPTSPSSITTSSCPTTLTPLLLNRLHLLDRIAYSLDQPLSAGHATSNPFTPQLIGLVDHTPGLVPTRCPSGPWRSCRPSPRTGCSGAGRLPRGSAGRVQPRSQRRQGTAPGSRPGQTWCRGQSSPRSRPGTR